jgi:hypothetical protein
MSDHLRCRDCGRHHATGLDAALCQRRIHERAHRGNIDDCRDSDCKIARYALNHGASTEERGE